MLVLCAGAFQTLYDTEDEITFVEEWEEISIADHVWEAGILPDELLMRLAPGSVEIPPPNANWLATRLWQIDKDVLGSTRLTAEQYQKKAGEMVRTKRNLRSLEVYLLDAWTRKSQAAQAGESIPPAELPDATDDLKN